MTDENKNGVEDEFDVKDENEMQEIHDFDFQRAVMLMSIAEKVATIAPKATSLLGIAQAELAHMNDQAKEIARRRAERAAEAESRRYAAEQERVNREIAEVAKDWGVDEDTVARDQSPGGPRAIPRHHFQPQPQSPQRPGEPAPQRRV